MTKQLCFKVQTVEYLITMSFQSISQTNMISVTLAMKFHKEQNLAQNLERKPKKIIQLCSQGTQALQTLQQILAAFLFLIHSKIFHIPNLCVSVIKDGPKSITLVSHLNMFSDISAEECLQGKRKGETGRKGHLGHSIPLFLFLKIFKGK